MHTKQRLQNSAQWETEEPSQALETGRAGFVPGNAVHLVYMDMFLNLNCLTWRMVVPSTYFVVLLQECKEIIQEK